MPVEGEGWLLGLLALVMLLGAARHRLEPWLEPPLPAPPPAVEAARFGRLDLNRATAGELVRLPGIGPRLAERILSRRRTNGRFRAVDELTLVHGIGPAILERVRSQVCVEPADSTVSQGATGGAEP